MKRAGLFLLATCVALLAAPLMAQTPSSAIVRVAIWKVKPGMGKQFQDGVRKHNEFHVKVNDPVALETWEVTSGDDTGTFLRIVSLPNWAAYDTPNYDTAADEADSATNIDPYMEAGPVRWWRFLPEVSHGPMTGTPPAMDEVLFFHLNMGYGRDFSALIKKITDAARASNWGVHYYWYVLENGGEHPTFALVIPKQKMADFDDPPVTFQAMLEKALGRAEAEMVYRALDKSIHCQRSQTIAYRGDLSYTPAKK
ncbi:MAG TPA: hypothetical protein VNN18_06835 [Candidatus Xenobia bacterium]|nr:hypothetical protein [Candidatus Xenobia bacterium]